MTVRMIFFVLTLYTVTAQAEPVTVAVAGNFVRPLESLSVVFEKETRFEVVAIPGSTGKLYAQVIHGARYDIFLAADQWRPQKLIELGYAQPGSAHNYAIGQLVLWSRDSGDCRALLQSGQFRHLAIANPALAPYGVAAESWLKNNGLYDRLQGQLVFGESIGQTFHFVATGNAQLGLLAASQLVGSLHGCIEPIEAGEHEPVVQQAVLLSRAARHPGALQFLKFLRSETAATIIKQHGYLVPAVTGQD